MLRIRQTERGNTPVVVCDACGELIEHASDGVSLYRAFSEEIKRPSGAALHLLHNACREPFESEHGGRLFWLGTGLDTVPYHLAKALHRRRSPIRGWLERVARFGRVAGPRPPRLLDVLPDSRA